MKSKSIKKILILVIACALPGLASAATLSVSPSTQNVRVGQTFSVTVQLDTQGVAVDGVDLRYLNYNPSLLQVVDANTSMAGVQISPGMLMPSTLLNNADNSQGKISFSQVAAGGTKYTGSGVLITISFRAIAPGVAPITLNYASGNTTDSNVAAVGVDVLTAVINGSYTVTGSGGVTLPIVTPPVTNPVVTSPSSNTNPSTPRPSTLQPGENFVPVPVAVDDPVVSSQTQGSFWDLIEYVFSRVKNGFLKLFGR